MFCICRGGVWTCWPVGLRTSGPGMVDFEGLRMHDSGSQCHEVVGKDPKLEIKK